MIARLIGTAAVAALLAGAAHAQSAGPVSPSQSTAQTATGVWTGPLGDSSPSANAGPGPVNPPAASMDSTVTASAAAPPAADASAAAADVSATVPAPTVTVSTVTNGPVPDTPENRAKYGQPLSRAGKMTRAAGN